MILRPRVRIVEKGALAKHLYYLCSLQPLKNSYNALYISVSKKFNLGRTWQTETTTNWCETADRPINASSPHSNAISSKTSSISPTTHTSRMMSANIFKLEVQDNQLGTPSNGSFLDFFMFTCKEKNLESKHFIPNTPHGGPTCFFDGSQFIEFILYVLLAALIFVVWYISFCTVVSLIPSRKPVWRDSKCVNHRYREEMVWKVFAKMRINTSGIKKCPHLHAYYLRYFHLSTRLHSSSPPRCQMTATE